MKKISFIHPFLLPGFILLTCSVQAAETVNDYIFDPSLLRDAIPGRISVTNGANDPYFQPGTYDVDIYLNGKYQSTASLDLIRDKGKISVCLPPRFYRAFAVREAYLAALPEKGCSNPENLLQGTSVSVDTASLRVDVIIPQAMLDIRPDDYISPENLTAGSTMGFINYNVNQFYSNYKNAGHFESTYLGFNDGINIGKWRFRQQGNFMHNEYGNHWQHTRTWLQRAFPSLRSEISVGDLFSSGGQFNAVSYRGIRLSSDARMLPDSLRGYAPEVHGMANSNARVSVWQGKQQIYQTTVPPGPFVIDNLSPVSYGGDLNVEVQESDGRHHRFRVPYAILPESLRPGRTDYSFSAGKVGDYTRDNNFAEMTVKRGLTNALTMNGGLRLANNYRSVLAGGVWASELGAFGLNSAFSSADFRNGDSSQGWRYELNYSRTFAPTNTTLTFAGYRYSTQGYRDLNDVIALNNNSIPGSDGSSSEYLQRNRLQLTLNQPLGDLGSLYVSWAQQNYYDHRSHDTQYQIGYGTVLPGDISMNFTMARQYSVMARHSDIRQSLACQMNEYRKDMHFQINFSIPLSNASDSSYLTLGGSSDNSYNASLSGLMGENNKMSYSININRDQQQRDTTFSGSLNRKTNLMNLTTTVSKSSKFNQMSVNAMGAAVLHSGGLSLGNYLSDSFALVEAKGAQGARIMGQGIEIDHNGYALVPSLMPYHYNTIALDSSGSNRQVEVLSSQKTVAPSAGAMVRVKFQTLQGYAVMMKASTNRDENVPMGADVIDANGKTIGTFGQGSNAYLRLNDTKGTLKAVWGDAPGQSCQINYQIPVPKPDAVITYANAVCRF
ncbi:fimbria/pilus outer membrane usher protein [Escherichia coli]|uniref:fimbria/pilus outer membrane usher protein n=1 Tax=Escherichia coli TaxID=562 RepID=UPI000B7C92B7|nr:fimbria/pilus outer membrane usher protein [Escherichia coli]